MSLEDLLQNILTYHSPDHIRLQLESQDVHLWQRDTPAELYAQLDEKLHQLSVDHSPYWLVRQLCTKSGLIAMMKEQFPEAASGVDFQALEMSNLTRCVLEAFGTPLSIPMQPKGIARIRNELDGYKQQIDWYIRQSGRIQRAGGRELHMLGD